MADKLPLHQQQERDDEDVEDLFQVAVQPVALEVPGYQQPGSPHQQPQQQQQGGAGGKEPLLPPGSMSSSASAADSVPVAGPDGSRPYTTLTEPVTETLKRDVLRVVTNLRNVVFPNPYRQSSSLRDWDLWGPFFFIIFLALILSSSASKNKSEVFATVFGVLSLGAIILTLNVLLLGGRIIFFQSLSVLGYCLFPLDLGALVCLFVTAKLIRFVVIVVMLVWSSWAAYPFVSGAVSDARKALAVYPVFLLYISMGFLVLGND